MTDALIPDGAALVRSYDALCDRHGIVCLNVYDGHVFALMRDGAELPLADLLAKASRPEVETSGDGRVTQFKPAPRRTD